MRILVILSGADLQRRTSEGRISPKANDLIRAIEVSQGIEVVFRIHPDRNFAIRSAYGSGFEQIVLTPLKFAKIAFQGLTSFLISLAKTRGEGQADIAMGGFYSSLTQFRTSLIRRYWKSEFKTLRPSAVVGISLNSEILISAGELEIATIEIQHGEFSGPDIYWTNNRPDAITLWPGSKQKPFIDAGMIPIQSPFPSFKTSPSSQRQVECRPEVTASILVFLTYGEASSEDPTGAMPLPLYNYCMKLYKAGYALHFRPHPVHARALSGKLKRFLRVRFAESRVIVPSHEGIEESLARVSISVIHRSSSFIDSVFQNVPVQVTDPDFFEYISVTYPKHYSGLVLKSKVESIKPQIQDSKDRLAAAAANTEELSWQQTAKLILDLAGN